MKVPGVYTLLAWASYPFECMDLADIKISRWPICANRSCVIKCRERRTGDVKQFLTFSATEMDGINPFFGKNLSKLECI